MPIVAGYALLALIPITVVLFCAVTWQQYNLFRYLSVAHTQLWETMDEPWQFGRNSWHAYRSVWRFLRHREYAAIGDAELTRMADRVRVLFPTYVVAFLSTVVLLSWLFHSHGPGGRVQLR